MDYDPELLKNAKESLKQQEAQLAKQKKEAQLAKQREPILAELELARKKNNLDSMYLALSQLKSIDPSKDLQKELEQVSKAVSLLEKIKVNKSDHDHENVVHYAHQLLLLFPDHTEARKALKESGLLFGYLKLAHHSVDSILDKESASFIKTDGSKVDYESLLSNINKAKKYLGEAKKLDGFFTQTIALEESLQNLENNLATKLSSNIASTALEAGSKLESTFNTVYRRMELEHQLSLSYIRLGSSLRGKSTSEAFAATASLRNSTTMMVDLYLIIIGDDVEALKLLKDSERSEEVRAASDLLNRVKRLKREVMEPSGSMKEYKSDVSNAVDAVVEQNSIYKQSLPTKSQQEEDFKNLLMTIVGFKLYQQPENTKPILETHKKFLNIDKI